MFLSLAEAERAARMVRKVTGREVGVGGDQWNGYAVEDEDIPKRLRDWDEVAEFVENHIPDPPRDERADRLEYARNLLAKAQDPWQGSDLRFDYLTKVVEKVLELV